MKKTPVAVKALLAAIAMAAAGTSALASVDLGRAVSAIGLTPTALAAAGISAAQTTDILNTVVGAPEFAAVLAARGEADSAQTNFDTTVARSDPLTASGAGALNAARMRLSSARTALELARAALASAAIAGQDSAVQARMRSWWNAPADLPPELRIVNWSADDLALLRRALLHERLLASGGEPLTSGEAAMLQQSRARADVIAAAARLQADVAAISAVIDAATQ